MALENQLQGIIQDYESTVRNLDERARNVEGRSYGGFIRAHKGQLQERITESLVRIAWEFVGGNPESIEINSKKIPIPIKNEYIDRISEPEVAEYIRLNVDDYVYKLSVDKHVFINEEFVVGIECKAFAENAMIKRILIDFDFLKTQHPDLSCYLFQFESQLGGDYSSLTTPAYGSHPTHTIQSYFSCDLKIVTLLEGERQIDRPIHTHFKPLKIEDLKNAVDLLAKDIERFV